MAKPERSGLAEGTVTETDSWKTELEPRVADEVQVIVDAFAAREKGEGKTGGGKRGGGRRGGKGGGGKDGASPIVPVVDHKDNRLDYMYYKDQLLVREQYLSRVLEILGQPEEAELRQREVPLIQPIIAGVVLLTLSETAKRERLEVPRAAALVDGVLGPGIVTPNHVLTVAGNTGGCPATDPEEVYAGIEPYPSVCHGNGGDGVLIYMADTGLLADPAHGHPWLAGVQPTGFSGPDPGDGQVPIPPYTAHGTFVAGVTRCMAPAADIIVTNAFAVAGSTLESDLVPRLVQALGLGVDIFHLTIAAPARKDLPLITFEAWLRLLRQYKGVICVAAAGNSGSRRPSWPAAFAEVISVGALGADWRGRASFSNFGGWVDVYAPGRDLVNAYATGTYICHVAPYQGQPRQFYGMARWSGTSFSTPIVTGLIAARMSRTGENSVQAAAALLAQARRQAIPGVGPVLLPCCDSGDAPGGPCGRCGPAEPGCGCGRQRRPCAC
jgi:Subtilase family